MIYLSFFFFFFYMRFWIINFYVSAERIASGFGIGALEELDVEDEDVYTSG